MQLRREEVSWVSLDVNEEEVDDWFSQTRTAAAKGRRARYEEDVEDASGQLEHSVAKPAWAKIFVGLRVG